MKKTVRTFVMSSVAALGFGLSALAVQVMTFTGENAAGDCYAVWSLYAVKTVVPGAKVSFSAEDEDVFGEKLVNYVVTEFPRIDIVLAGETDSATNGCKATEAGSYLVGKKATLKLTMPKGTKASATCFLGWYLDGQPWPNASEDGKYHVVLATKGKNPDALALELDPSRAWNEDQLTGAKVVKGKPATYKVSAVGYANVCLMTNGAFVADFAPVLAVDGKKRVLSIHTKLWMDRSNEHVKDGIGVGDAKFTG